MRGSIGLLLAATLALPLAAGCGDEAKDAQAATLGEQKESKGKGAKPGSAPVGRAASAEAARRFLTWTPVPAFLSAQVVGGVVVSDAEAIVFTKDNHVGVTRDGGTSWGFTRITTGTVKAVAGAKGGPFVVVGAGGFVSLSPDGRSFTDLPRETDEDLVAVAVGAQEIAAVGQKGAFVKMDRQGNAPAVSTLPDKFKAQGVVIEHDRYVVYAGKRAYEARDNAAWTPIDYTLEASGQIPTSRGLCALGNVGKKKGVVCKVEGAAYGLGKGEVLVIGKSWLALTRDAGSSWALAPLPMKGIKGVAGGSGGAVHVYDARGAISSSSDGRTWEAGTDPSVIEGAPVFPKPQKCEGRLPEPGDACQLVRETTSPADLPNVRAFRFHKEVGIAMGESALVAMTTDGGRTWRATSGFALGNLQGFDVRGDRVVVVGGTKTALSSDAGKTFRTIDLPPKTPSIYATQITSDGAIYLAGRAGNIIKMDKDLGAWVKLDTGPKNRVDYFALAEHNGAIYASGSRGELHRSADGGKSWTPIATGVGQVVQKIAGEGDVVFAMTLSTRYGGNKLLRSTDNGRHFVVQRELSDQGVVDELVYEAGTLRYGNLVSKDDGATWNKASEWYWSGSVDTADGSGVRIANVSSYAGKDRFYVIGTEKDDYTVVESFYNKGGWFRCDAASGCWMFAGGQLYRPIAE